MKPPVVHYTYTSRYSIEARCTLHGPLSEYSLHYCLNEETDHACKLDRHNLLVSCSPPKCLCHFEEHDNQHSNHSSPPVSTMLSRRSIRSDITFNILLPQIPKKNWVLCVLFRREEEDDGNRTVHIVCVHLRHSLSLAKLVGTKSGMMVLSTSHAEHILQRFHYLLSVLNARVKYSSSMAKELRIPLLVPKYRHTTFDIFLRGVNDAVDVTTHHRSVHGLGGILCSDPANILLVLNFFTDHDSDYSGPWTLEWSAFVVLCVTDAHILLSMMKTCPAIVPYSKSAEILSYLPKAQLQYIIEATERTHHVKLRPKHFPRVLEAGGIMSRRCELLLVQRYFKAWVVEIQKVLETRSRLRMYAQVMEKKFWLLQYQTHFHRWKSIVEDRRRNRFV